MRLFPASLVAALLLPSLLPGADLRYPDDATLHAIQFIDTKEGWAVGDEGVVWHSIDGGQNWERQPTGLRASLRSLHFLNPYVGWVAGREELPHGGGSVGVLLFTRDGGLKWQRLLANSLPGLNLVRFSDPKTGYIFGDGSETFPSGVFKTEDGGRSWEPVSGPRATTWLAGSVAEAGQVLLGGAWGRLATLRQGGFGIADIEGLGGRNLRGLHVLGKRALAVGQGGLVLTSVSGGSRWGFAQMKLPPEVLANLDFHAVHGVGDRAWVVGRPGSVLLTTSDQGATWKLHKTGHDLPLQGVFFVDSQRGWAVGDAGCILATTDGGQKWSVQRRGGKRASLLLVHAHPQDLPLDTLSALGADEGYLGTALQVVAPPVNASFPAGAIKPMRWAAAVRGAGGLTGELLWQFPLPSHFYTAGKKDLLNHWNVAHDGRADQQLLRQLVLALRLWRPDVLVTDLGKRGEGRVASGEWRGTRGEKKDDSLNAPLASSSLVVEAILQARVLAADPKAFPEQLEQLGLSPWQVARVFTVTDKREEAQVVQDNHEIRNRLGTTARDFAAGAAGLLHQEPPEIPAQRYYRLAAGKEGETGNLAHLLAGLDLQPGAGGRRHLAEAKAVADEVIKAVRSRRNLEILVGKLADPAKALGQLGRTLAEMPDDQGAAAAFAIAHLYARRGQWQLAQEAFLLMVDRYPAHPLALDAYRWLIRHSSSSEAKRRQELGQFLVTTKVGFGQAQFLAEKKRPRNPDPEGKITTVAGTETVASGQLAYLSNHKDIRHWYRSSLELSKRLYGFGPVFAADPSIQFCLQASRRHLGDFESARQWYSNFVAHAAPGPWREAAAAELWLSQRTVKPPRPVTACPLVQTRPFLDGKLDDACWQGMKPLTLGNASGDTAKDYPTQVWLAYDRDFLYIACSCQHPAGQRVPPVKNRTRDPNLQSFDRLSLLLDLDRDYTTYYHLQIDQRGCVREDCWGDVTWNPRWFVAVHSTDTCWHMEAAIPLTELSGDHVRSSTAWAGNVIRTLPGRGLQAWSLPADVQPRPEGLGLWLFQSEASQPGPKQTP